MKYRLLIADDEQLIRESLLQEYDWAAHDIEVTACCRNGLEALDAMVDGAPDIVLTDIRMPGMSGLDLLGKLHELDPSVICVILSGYCDFNYAKQAMAYGVKHYLTKPLEPGKLWAAIEDCQRTIDRQERYARLDAFSHRVFGEQPPAAGERDAGAVEAIREYVMAHISDSKLSLNRIAREVLFMNVDYLSHLFVAETGKRFSAYLNESRVNLAKELLDRGDLPVHRVAERVGCGENPHYFSQLFKKNTGMTPTAYNNRNR